jgi:hypothetical protein
MPTGSVFLELFLSEAFTNGATGANIDPAPMAPIVFKNARREFFFSFFDKVSPLYPLSFGYLASIFQKMGSGLDPDQRLYTGFDLFDKLFVSKTKGPCKSIITDQALAPFFCKILPAKSSIPPNQHREGRAQWNTPINPARLK